MRRILQECSVPRHVLPVSRLVETLQHTLVNNCRGFTFYSHSAFYRYTVPRLSPYPAYPQYPMDTDPRQSDDPPSYSAPAYYQPEGPYMPSYDPPAGSYRAPFTAPFFVPQLSDPPAPVSYTPAPYVPPMKPYTTPPPYTPPPRYTTPAPYATRPPYAAREVNSQQPDLSMRCAWHNSNWRCVVPTASRSRAISLL